MNAECEARASVGSQAFVANLASVAHVALEAKLVGVGQTDDPATVVSADVSSVALHIADDCTLDPVCLSSSDCLQALVSVASVAHEVCVAKRVVRGVSAKQAYTAPVASVALAVGQFVDLVALRADRADLVCAASPDREANRRRGLLAPPARVGRVVDRVCLAQLA